MELRIPRNYLILKENSPLKLPDFVLITGENGSGKTKLLEVISDSMHPECLFDDDGNPYDQFEYIPANGFEPTLGNYHSIQYDQQQYAKQLILDSFLGSQEEYFKTTPLTADNVNNRFNAVLSPNISHGTQIFNSVDLQSVIAISENSGKKFGQLKYFDFTIFSPIDTHQLFSSNLLKLYHQYAYKYWNYREQAEKEIAPWLSLEKIVEVANFNYTIKHPDLDADNVVLEPIFIHKVKNIPIKLYELSSGEKTIISLIFALYNLRSNQKGFTSIPQVIVLDEPDASLHPSLTKYFLDVIQNVLMEDDRVKVIITTHSPSTVALAPDDSIFLMEDGILKETDKSTAIKSLTTGLKSLSIYYEHKKQVFVEADFDVDFYGFIYQKISTQHLDKEIILNFISVGNAAGGFTRVIKMVKDLNLAGNKNICGIIDRDDDHQANEKVMVLGNGERRNIENYLFDPLFFGLFVLKEEYPKHNERFGLNKTDDYLDYNNLDESKIQNIINLVINDIKIHLSDELMQPSENSEIELLCLYKIKIPLWFFELKKVSIEEAYSNSFGYLFDKYRNKKGIKPELLKILTTYYKFLPVGIVKMFKAVQEIEL